MSSKSPEGLALGTLLAPALMWPLQLISSTPCSERTKFLLALDRASAVVLWRERTAGARLDRQMGAGQPRGHLGLLKDMVLQQSQFWWGLMSAQLCCWERDIPAASAPPCRDHCPTSDPTTRAQGQLGPCLPSKRSC